MQSKKSNTVSKTSSVVESDVHVGEASDQPSAWYRRKLSILIIMGIFVLVIISVGVIVKRSSDNSQELTTSQLSAQLDKDIKSGNYNASITALKKAPPTKENQTLLLSAYQNQGDNKAALGVYKDLIAKYGASLGYIEGAATTAESAKDYKQAIKYYSQARAITEKQPSATQKAEIANYDVKIESLKAKQ